MSTFIPSTWSPQPFWGSKDHAIRKRWFLSTSIFMSSMYVYVHSYQHLVDKFYVNYTINCMYVPFTHNSRSIIPSMLSFFRLTPVSSKGAAYLDKVRTNSQFYLDHAEHYKDTLVGAGRPGWMEGRTIMFRNTQCMGYIYLQFAWILW